MNQLTWLLLFFLIITNTTYARDATDAVYDVDQFIADGAIKLFYIGCLKYYSNEAEFEIWIKRNSFRMIPNIASANFLKRPGGKAYSVSNTDFTNDVSVDYVLAAEADNQCTVFIKKVDLSKIRKTFAKLSTKLISSDLTLNSSSKIKNISGGTIKTIEYKYYKEGELHMTIEVTESIFENSVYTFIISAITNNRAGNSFE